MLTCKSHQPENSGGENHENRYQANDNKDGKKSMMEVGDATSHF